MTFQELQASTHYIAVSVPSTADVDQAIGKQSLADRTETIARVLSDMFGGASVSDVSGSWVSDSGAYIQEPIKRVLSYNPGMTQEQETTIIDLVKSKAQEWGQEAIMVEVDNRAYFIS